MVGWLKSLTGALPEQLISPSELPGRPSSVIP